MKTSLKLIFTLFVFCFIIYGCKNNCHKNDSDSNKFVNVDTITVNVDEKGNMTVGNRQTDIDNLESLLIDSVKTIKSKGQTNVPDFNLEVKGEGMLMGGRSMVQDIFEVVKQSF